MSALVPMAIMALQVWACGYVIGHERDDLSIQIPMVLLGAALIVAALYGGFYWNLFGRGHGFFSANRTTALLALIGVLVAGAWQGYRHNRRVR